MIHIPSQQAWIESMNIIHELTERRAFSYSHSCIITRAYITEIIMSLYPQHSKENLISVISGKRDRHDTCQGSIVVCTVCG